MYYQMTSVFLGVFCLCGKKRIWCSKTESSVIDNRQLFYGSSFPYYQTLIGMGRLDPNSPPFVKCRRTRLPIRSIGQLFFCVDLGSWPFGTSGWHISERVFHAALRGGLFQLATNSKVCLSCWCKRKWSNTSLVFKYHKIQVPDGQTKVSQKQ